MLRRLLKAAIPAALAATTATLAAGAAAPATASAKPATAERVLLMLSDGVPATLDVDGPAGNHKPTQMALINVLEPLVDYARKRTNADGVDELDFDRIEPRLAESWSYDAATLTWTFRLRRDVRSCAGNPLTADDVLYTFARAKSLSGSAPVGWFIANVASVEGFTPALFGEEARRSGKRELGAEVRKVDAHTVQIRQSGPNRMFLPALAIFGLGIYDQRAMRAHATPEDPWSHGHTARVDAPSFGPWCVVDWRKDEHFIVRANPHYYRGRAWFDRVILRNVPQSANRVGILRTGKAQLIDGLSPKEYAFLAQRPEVKVGGGYLNGTLIMMANWKAPPLDDERVRRALAHAIPYDQVIRDGYFGAATQYHGLVPTPYPGRIAPTARYQYDPARAAQLLAEAGYPGGRGLERYAASFRLSYGLSREVVLGPVATTLRSALRKVGFPVELDPLPDVQLADRQLVKKDLPLSLYDGLVPIGVDAAYAILLSYVSPPRGLNNMTNFRDTEVDAHFGRALNEPDPARRGAELAAAQQIIAARLAAIPMLEYKAQWAHDPRLRGLTLHPTQQVRWYSLRLEATPGSPR
jgi:peptide/nickel transport system substrate-binding protein